MKKSLLLIFVLACLVNFTKAQETVTITHIGDVELPSENPVELLLGTKISVKATYSNPENATSVKVSVVSSTAWASDWASSQIMLDSIALDTSNGMIDVMIPVPANFPLQNVPEGKNDVQYVQVTVQYPEEKVEPYEFVKVTMESEKNMAVITEIGPFVFPDTTSAKEFDNKAPIPVKAYYTNPENASSVQISLVSATNWATDWKSTAITFDAPFDGMIDTFFTVPEDFPVWNFPEGKNNIQYIQVNVQYPDGKQQPYELIRLTGEAVIVEGISDYLTSLTMTINEDTTKYNYGGWVVVGEQETGTMFHLQGTYEAEKSGHKATSVTISVSDFKADWSGMNYSFGQIIADEEKGNINGVIDHKIRIPNFYPEEFLVTDDAAVSNQMVQVRVTYDDIVASPFAGGVYSNYQMDVKAATVSPSTCMDVGGIMMSDITGSTIMLDWDLGNDAAWDVLIAEEGTIRNPDASEDYVSVNAIPFVYSGLMPDTDYEMYIRTVCDNDTLNYTTGGYSEKMLFSTTGSTGIKLMNNIALNLYPNPVNDVLNIDTDGAYSIRVLDITGRVVLSREMKDTQERLNVSDLNPGMYVLKLGNQEKQISRKFIKK